MAPPDFYPDRQHPFATRLFQSLAFTLAWWKFQLRLRVSWTDVAKLQQLRGSRVILLPNHPTFNDPVVLFLLSAQAGEIFYYLSAYANFKGLTGKLLQRLGAYSIKRGVGDRTSIAYTLNLLASKPDCRLVIFAEGGCSFQNDTVMAFRTGAVQLTMQAMARIVKQTGEIPNIYLLPVSLKYRYTRPMNSVIENSLTALEKALGITPEILDFYPRLRAIGECVAAQFEREYIGHPLAGSLNERIEEIRAEMLITCEREIGLDPVPSLPLRERIYRVQAIVEEQEEPSPELQKIYQSTVRLLNFDALYDGYVAAAPTAERFLDTLTRLEREVFNIDKPEPKGDRLAYIKLGDPVNLADYYEAYRGDRTATVEELTAQMQQIVQANLDILAGG